MKRVVINRVLALMALFCVAGNGLCASVADADRDRVVPAASKEGITVGSDVLVLAGGKTKTDWAPMIEALAKADVVFLGEQHDHTGGHALQLEILKAVFAQRAKVALSMEMFERDVQSVLDEYLNETISEASFLQASRPWPNYKADYRPLVEFCKANHLPVVAANAPRRYVSIVSRKGVEPLKSLSGEAKRWLAPLPYSMKLPEGYEKQLDEIFGGAHDQPAAKPATPPVPAPAAMTMPSPQNMKAAQALWDATMADSVRHARRKHRGRLIIQMNGSMHSDSGYGIAARLREAEPKLKVVIVTVRPDTEFPNISATKYADLADFVLVTRPDPKAPPTAPGATR